MGFGKGQTERHHHCHNLGVVESARISVSHAEESWKKDMQKLVVGLFNVVTVECFW